MNRATISVECAHSAHGECRFEDCACICHAPADDLDAYAIRDEAERRAICGDCVQRLGGISAAIAGRHQMLL